MDDQPKNDPIAEIVSELSTEARRLAEIAFPAEIILSCAPDGEPYNAETHAKICRLKMLGLNNETVAKAIGVRASMLTEWSQRFPKLKTDLERAEALCVGSAAAILQQLMREGGSTGIQAVKYFLSCRSSEFKERTEVEIRTSMTREEIVRTIRVQMYGIRDENAVPEALESEKTAAPTATADLRLESIEKRLEPIAL
jgi:hypothetical protein